MVFVIKYRKTVLTEAIFESLKLVCKEIEERYYLTFDALGSDGDHFHLVVEAAPRYAPSRVMQICKSITAIQIFKQFPEVKQDLWEENSGVLVGILILLEMEERWKKSTNM